MKLNFGGVKGEKSYSWMNVGLGEDSGILHDLNVYPLPFYENSIDEIYCSHVLEHLKEPLEFLKECYRIMKPGARMTIRVPHVSAFGGAFGNMEHRHFYNENAISTITSSNSTVVNYRFKLISTKIIRARFCKWRKHEIIWIIEK